MQDHEGREERRNLRQRQRHRQRHERQRRDEESRADVAEVIRAEYRGAQQQLPAFGAAQRPEGYGRQQEDRAEEAGKRAVGSHLQGDLPSAFQVVALQVGAVLAFEGHGDIGVRKDPVEERSYGVPYLDPVLGQPRGNHDGGERGDDGAVAQAPALPGHEPESVRDGQPGGQFRGVSEAGQEADCHQHPAGAPGVPQLQQVEERKCDCGNRDIHVGAGAGHAYDRTGKHQECGADAGGAPAAIGRVPVDLPGEREQEDEVNHGRGRVPAECEGHQVEHLDALREAGIQVVDNRVEPVLAKVAADQAEVVAAAVEAEFRRHRVRQVEDEVEAEEQEDDAGDGADLKGPDELPPSRGEDDRAPREKYQRVGGANTAEKEYGQAHHGGAGDEPDGWVAAFGTEQQAAGNPADCRREGRAEHDGQGLQSRF